MKQTCLLFFLFNVSLAAFSQTKSLELSLFPKYKNENAWLFTPYKQQPGFNSNSLPVKASLHNKMPCFVPDISLMAPIPTLDPKPITYIPNPYYKFNN
jgi:hypothetical protein